MREAAPSSQGITGTDHVRPHDPEPRPVDPDVRIRRRARPARLGWRAFARDRWAPPLPGRRRPACRGWRRLGRLRTGLAVLCGRARILLTLLSGRAAD